MWQRGFWKIDLHLLSQKKELYYTVQTRLDDPDFAAGVCLRVLQIQLGFIRHVLFRFNGNNQRDNL